MEAWRPVDFTGSSGRTRPGREEKTSLRVRGQRSRRGGRHRMSALRIDRYRPQGLSRRNNGFGNFGLLVQLRRLRIRAAHRRGGSMTFIASGST